MTIGLDSLGRSVANQFLASENPEAQRTLRGKLAGEEVNYGRLGNFARQIDQSAQRNYLEQGYLNNNFDSVSAKMTQISMQQPEATVIVRKKMYTSLAHNYAPEYMSEDEKITYLAMDKLFLNKAKQIAAYEQLCKIQSASQKVGEVDEQLLPIIIGFNDFISSGVDTVTSGNQSSNKSSVLGSFGDVVRKIKAVYNYSGSNFYTTWIEDVVTPYSLRFGYGTGAIEFTSFSNLNTSCDLKGGGNFSITFDDPYNLMTITPGDIEKAISDVMSVENFLPSLALGKETSEQLVDRKISELNAFRTQRGASPISFKINSNTIYGKKVIAIVDALGVEIPFEAKLPGLSFFGSVEVPSEYLLDGEVLGVQGLSKEKKQNPLGKAIGADGNDELSIFTEVVNSIFNKLSLDKLTDTQYDFVNGKKSETVNYVRRKLIFYFANKNIIQPMDVVNIYISSKQKYDDKIMSGMKNAFAGFGLLGSISNQVYDVWNQTSALFLPSSNLDLQMEKSLILGGSNAIPNYIWLSLRGKFTSEKEGCHVFAGIFNSVKSSFADGAYSVTATGVDNTYYLKLSNINFKPGADNSNSLFYNPLTPYKTKFDSVYNSAEELELLDENKELVSSEDFKIIIPAGKDAGKPIYNTKNLPSEITYSSVKEEPGTPKNKTIFAPDGLVYKWKEGIETLSLKGTQSATNTPRIYGSQSSSQDALANQDIMNVVSLLVTGQPYNYYTYYKTAIELNNEVVNRDRTALTNSRLSQLRESISENNLVWGNFLPFKSATVSASNFSEMISAKNQEIVKNQALLSNLYREADRLKNNIIISSLNLETGKYEVSSNVEKYKVAIEGLNQKIATVQGSFTSLVSDKNFSIIGNDVSADYDLTINNDGNDDGSGNSRNIRRKNNFLTRRLSWAVRSNADKNYLIVDDSYDKNNDLLAFEADIAGSKAQLYGNAYTKVYEKVENAVKVLGMEFFADTQGHLRVRVPQYNKMPSSVFLTMLSNKKSKKNIQIVPKFFNSLILNQVKVLYDQLSALEDEIRFYCVLVGAGNTSTNDTPAIKYLQGTVSKNKEALSKKKPFEFLSSPSNGEIINLDSVILNLKNLDSGLTSESFLTVKKLKDKLQDQLNISNTFDISSRITKTQEVLSKFLKNSIVEDQITYIEKNKKFIEDLIVRVYNKTGKTLKPEAIIGSSSSEKDLLFNNVLFPKLYTINSADLNDKISKNLSQRQKLVKQLFFNVKNSYEFNSLDNEDLAIKYFTSGPLNNSKDVPEIFDYLIEDESYDDLGPGSGSRYIIKNSQIINYNISENEPEYTTVTVTGRLQKNFQLKSSSAFNNLPGSDVNALVSSSAIDYDLWKMYGLKPSQIDKPFLTNASTQTTPYAVGLLMSQRRNIFKGSANIFGNEYMQPGEVVYLEQHGMLFYVESVAHIFDYSGTFTTTLTLTYGHYPGEYIPTQLDLAGKLLYVNRGNTEVEMKKGLETKGGKAIASLVMFGENYLDNFSDKTPVGQANSGTLSKIVLRLRSELKSTASVQSAPLKTVLNIFVYESKSYKNNSKGFAEEVRKILLGKSIYDMKKYDPAFEAFTPDNVPEVNLINLSSEDPKQSPSRFAFSAASDLITKKTFVAGIKAKAQGTALGTVQLKKKYLCNSIVDFYIKTYPQNSK